MENILLTAVPGVWVLSPIITSTFFKVTHTVSNLPYNFFRGILAQAQTSDDNDELLIFEPRSISYRSESEILQLDQPPFFTDRKIAFKASQPSNLTNWNWSIEIMPLYNLPSNITIYNPSSIVAATTVSSSVTSVSLLTANSSRKGSTILNNSTANLFVELGSTASTTAYTVKVTAGGYYEVPFTYTGAIAGIWDAANGSALIRELT